MYLRFAITGKDADSHQRQGVFQTAWTLLDTGELCDAEAEDLRSLLLWFNANLPFPSREHRAVLSHRAIFWFKPDARRYFTPAWELAQLLRLHGFFVDMLKTQNPGSIVYADLFQIAAIPFKNTF